MCPEARNAADKVERRNNKPPDLAEPERAATYSLCDLSDSLELMPPQINIIDQDSSITEVGIVHGL